VIDKVYLLWFISADREKDDDGFEKDDDGLLIGVYDSELAARDAIGRLKSKPGFVDNPQGFQIHTRELGKDSWTEGFVRY